MSDPSTVYVHSIGGLEVTTNGEFLLIHGNQPTVAFHRSVFNDLLVALPNASNSMTRDEAGDRANADRRTSHRA
ncbi:hypothetical protein [Paraburkholderia lacunae]|uniref:hypothetical protein n=1 Tax=Paraburkholderia lacunae TaxID=2211104 RepID=UPI001402CA7B|nr:hypothetical protein [Paraburkholderia lacunae]